MIKLEYQKSGGYIQRFLKSLWFEVILIFIVIGSFCYSRPDIAVVFLIPFVIRFLIGFKRTRTAIRSLMFFDDYISIHYDNLFFRKSMKIPKNKLSFEFGLEMGRGFMPVIKVFKSDRVVLIQYSNSDWNISEVKPLISALSNKAIKFKYTNRWEMNFHRFENKW